MHHSFRRVFRKTKKSWLKSVGNFVAKTVLIESANQFSLDELCRSIQYTAWNIFRSHIVHQTVWKILNDLLDYRCMAVQIRQLPCWQAFAINNQNLRSLPQLEIICTSGSRVTSVLAEKVSELHTKEWLEVFNDVLIQNVCLFHVRIGKSVVVIHSLNSDSWHKYTLESSIEQIDLLTP